MNKCSCPLGDFPTTEDVKCKKNFGQVQKVLFCDMRYLTKTRVKPFMTADEITQAIEASGVANSFVEGIYQLGDMYIIPLIPAPDDNYSTRLVGDYYSSYKELFEFLAGRREDVHENTVGDYIDGSPVGRNGAIITICPPLENPTQEPGEFRTMGGGNETPNGIEKYLGIGPSEFSAVMRGIPQTLIADLKYLECMADKGYLGVILINGENEMELIDDGSYADIEANANDSPIHRYLPIPIRSLRISDKIHGGYDNMDYNEISWRFLPNYSDNLVILGPNDGTGSISSIK